MNPRDPWESIIITGRGGAAKILKSPRKRAQLTALLSIGSPTEPPPAGYQDIARRLRLRFEDECEPARCGPVADDIEAIIAFGRTLDLKTGTLLVHCQAGVSRSAAAALVVLRTILGPGTEETLVCRLRSKYPECRPNALVLELADGILGSILAPAWRRCDLYGRE